jgi:hypothetical protein
VHLVALIRQTDEEPPGQPKVGLELARGIEPPTCGLQNRNRGLLESLMTWAIPLSLLAIRNSSSQSASVVLTAFQPDLFLFLTLY